MAARPPQATSIPPPSEQTIDIDQEINRVAGRSTDRPVEIAARSTPGSRDGRRIDRSRSRDGRRQDRRTVDGYREPSSRTEGLRAEASLRPMNLLERIQCAHSYGAHFYVCESCPNRCKTCGNQQGHSPSCWYNNPANHGRDPWNEMMWNPQHNQFVWPYVRSDSDWVSETMSHFERQFCTNETWCEDVYRGGDGYQRRGGYLVPPWAIRQAIMTSRNPPFTVHHSGLSGKQGQVPTLSGNKVGNKWNKVGNKWYPAFCVAWNLLSKPYGQYKDWVAAKRPGISCPCPKPRFGPNKCQNEEACSLIWCDGLLPDGTPCPTATWHREFETCLF